MTVRIHYSKNFDSALKVPANQVAKKVLDLISGIVVKTSYPLQTLGPEYRHLERYIAVDGSNPELLENSGINPFFESDRFEYDIFKKSINGFSISHVRFFSWSRKKVKYFGVEIVFLKNSFKIFSISFRYRVIENMPLYDRTPKIDFGNKSLQKEYLAQLTRWNIKVLAYKKLNDILDLTDSRR